jgi:hypothetical protein
MDAENQLTITLLFQRKFKNQIEIGIIFLLHKSDCLEFLNIMLD